jgi:hypothetical protein
MTGRRRESDAPNPRTAVTTLAEGLIARLDPTGEGRERSRVVSAWRLVAGPEVFSHSRGFALRDGELLVFVDSNSWATELSALGEHYKAALAMALGQETVTSLRFAVSRKVKEQISFEEQQLAEEAADAWWKAEPVAASPLERDQIEMMAAGIRDEQIRNAVVSAEIAHLEWRKGIEARKAAERASQRLRDANQDPQR